MENREENIVKEKVVKPKLTDADALEIVKSNAQSKFRFCDTFCTRTILYPVAVQYKPGEFTNEIRAFVRQGEWVNSRTWERALELEKEFSGLNKKLAEELKAAKKPINIKAPSDNATPLGISR